MDDNLIGNTSQSRARAAQIFQGMIDRRLNKMWCMQTSMNAADDEKLIELAGRSGAGIVLIGFETIEAETLKGMKKGVNLKTGVGNYRRVIETFHRNGIGVIGAFITGNDGEKQDYYQRLRDFILESGVDAVQLSILTPLPGTPLMEQMVNEGRLVCDNFPDDWEKFRFSYVVHRPTGKDAEAIYRGNNFIRKYLYHFPHFQMRMARSFFGVKNPKAFKFIYAFNRGYIRSWKNTHYYDPHAKLD